MTTVFVSDIISVFAYAPDMKRKVTMWIKVEINVIGTEVIKQIEMVGIPKWWLDLQGQYATGSLLKFLKVLMLE